MFQSSTGDQTFAALFPHRRREVRKQFASDRVIENALSLFGAEGDVLIDGEIGVSHLLAPSERLSNRSAVDFPCGRLPRVARPAGSQPVAMLLQPLRGCHRLSP